MNWTQADIDAAKRKMGTVAVTVRQNRKPCAKANRRTMHKSGKMNKLESAYAAYLEARKFTREISDWRFECVKFRLADNTFYTPDFAVIAPDGTFEIHEVKGHWEEDARVKIKVAAAQFPFEFIAVKRGKGGTWEREVF